MDQKIAIISVLATAVIVLGGALIAISLNKDDGKGESKEESLPDYEVYYWKTMTKEEKEKWLAPDKENYGSIKPDGERWYFTMSNGTVYDVKAYYFDHSSDYGNPDCQILHSTQYLTSPTAQHYSEIIEVNGNSHVVSMDNPGIVKIEIIRQ